MTNEEKIKRIVIWGLKYKYHTQRHIHQAFYKNAKKMGYDVVWLEDSKKDAKKIKGGDLIISSAAIGRMVPEKFTIDDYNLPIREDVFYCLHNYKDFFVDKLKFCNLTKIQFYSNENGSEQSDQKWSEVTYFNTKSRTLYQPWGTDLFPEEFKKPVFNKGSLVFWVGNVWNDKNNHGNLNEIAELKEVLFENKLKFIKVKVAPDFLHIFLIRNSRIAPAIGGGQQVKVNYLPCRVFKNVSYGQLGITNIRKFKDLFGDSFIEGDSIKDVVNNALALTKEEYIAKVIAQQEVVKEFTYKKAIENIIKTFSF